MDFILREWSEHDKESLVKHANNYNIARYLTNAFPYPYTMEDAEAYIDIVIKQKPAKILAISVLDEAVGSIGVFPQSDIHCINAEMGYWLSEAYWGQGIMTQAIKQMVDYGFDTFDIKRIFARPFGTNKASQRVLEKAGFILEARLETVLFKEGQFMDEYIYAVRK